MCTVITMVDVNNAHMTIQRMNDDVFNEMFTMLLPAMPSIESTQIAIEFLTLAFLLKMTLGRL